MGLKVAVKKGEMARRASRWRGKGWAEGPMCRVMGVRKRCLDRGI